MAEQFRQGPLSIGDHGLQYSSRSTGYTQKPSQRLASCSSQSDHNLVRGIVNSLDQFENARVNSGSYDGLQETSSKDFIGTMGAYTTGHGS